MSSVDWATIEAAIHNWVRIGADVAAERVIWDYEGGKRPPVPYVEMSIADVQRIGHDWRECTANPLTFTDITVTADPGTDELDATSHNLLTGDGPVRVTSTLTVPGGLAALTDYWIRKIDADNFKLSTTFVNAMNGVTIDITSAGTGVIKVVDTAETERQGQELTVSARGMRTAVLVLQAFGAPGIGEGATPILVDVVAALALHEYALDQAGIGVGEVGPVQLIEGRRGGILEPRARVEVVIHFGSELEAFETYIARTIITVTTIDSEVLSIP